MNGDFKRFLMQRQHPHPVLASYVISSNFIIGFWIIIDYYKGHRLIKKTKNMWPHITVFNMKDFYQFKKKNFEKKKRKKYIENLILN